MASAVGFANSDGYLGNGCFAVCKHQFCSVVNDTCVLLSGSAEETRNINEGQNLDIECVAETYETCGFAACVAIKHTCQPARLVSDDTGRTAVETRETADHILGEVFVNLHEISVIHDGVDDLVHVVRFVRICRNDVVQVVVHAGDIIGALYERSLLHVVLRDEGNETAYFSQRLFLRCCYEMGHTRFGSVDLGAAELLYGHVLACYGFDYLRTGDEHITVLLGHHDKVRQSRAVHCSTRARTEDNTDLRHYAGSQNVTLENLSVACKRAGTFLNTSAARVVQTDDRGTEFHCLIHHVADLLSHRLAQ